MDATDAIPIHCGASPPTAPLPLPTPMTTSKGGQKSCVFMGLQQGVAGGSRKPRLPV